MASSEPITVISNTCCPVCGVGIRPSHPSVEVRPGDLGHGLVVSLRVDSPECAAQVRAQPDRYLRAAEINQVAH